MVRSTAITTTSTTAVANTNVRPQLQSVSKVENIYYLTKKTNVAVSR